MAYHLLYKLGREHALHGGLYFVYAVVDYAVGAYLDIGAGGVIARGAVGPDVEADYQRVAGRGQHDVALVYRTDTGVDDLDADFFVGQLLERGLDRLGAALDVCLDNDVEVLYLALLYLGEEVVERNLLGDAERALLGLLLALLNQLARHALIGDGVEDVAGVRHFAHTCYLDRDARARFRDALALVVYHGAHVSHSGAGDYDIALMQRAVLDEHGHNRAAAAVQPGLNDGALGRTVRVGLELEHFGQDDQVLKQVVYALAGLGRDGANHRVAAPLLAHEVVLGELLLYALGVGAWHIHLVDGHDYGYIRGLGVVNRLYGLRHYAVIGGYNQDGDVRDGGAAGAHTGEGLVARGIQESYRTAVYIDGVGADVLGNAAGLSGRDVGVTDIVQEAGLAVIDVAHDHDDGRARLELFGLILAVV